MGLIDPGRSCPDDDLDRSFFDDHPGQGRSLYGSFVFGTLQLDLMSRWRLRSRFDRSCAAGLNGLISVFQRLDERLEEAAMRILFLALLVGRFTESQPALEGRSVDTGSDTGQIHRLAVVEGSANATGNRPIGNHDARPG